MVNALKTWLSNYLSISKEEIEQIGKPDVAGFLIVWTLFEQKSFNGFIKKSDIIPFAKKHASILSPLFQKHANHFHNRFQDSTMYRHLRHNDTLVEIDTILAKNFSLLNDEDKVTLTLYTLYRYRNNIFHGNKGVLSWMSYKEQINLCANAMTIIIDNNLTI